MPILGCLMTKTPRRYHVGITSVLRRCAILTCCVVPGVGMSSGLNAAWAEFERRCLIPFEDFAAPVVSDLPKHGDNAFLLPTGAVLKLVGATDDGTRSCIVEGAGLVKGFTKWRDDARATGRYVESDQPGYWLSHEWIEPVIAVEKSERAVRVVETELES